MKAMSNVILKVFDKVGAEARTRSNVVKLNITGLASDSNIIIDFEKVNFISRSFTDELLEQLLEKNISYNAINENDSIKNMIKAVTIGRSKERVRHTSDAEIMTINSMEELAKYLNFAF